MYDDYCSQSHDDIKAPGNDSTRPLLFSRRLKSTTNNGLGAIISELQTSVEEETFSPAFDDVIGFILRPALEQCRSSPHLEATLSFCCLVLEVCHALNDQLEKRSYGKDNLCRVIEELTKTYRQIRVVLLLKSSYQDCYQELQFVSSFDHEITEEFVELFSEAKEVELMTRQAVYSIDNFTSGRISLFRILAHDSLQFSDTAATAREHEERCLDAFISRVKSKKSDLWDWESVADRKWKDILSLALVNSKNVHGMDAGKDEVDRQSSEKTVVFKEKLEKVKKMKKRPLLLYFPEYNNSLYLSCYRSLLLAEQWSSDKREISAACECLCAAYEHLSEAPASNLKTATAYFMYEVYVKPVVRGVVRLEEGDDEGDEGEEEEEEEEVPLKTSGFKPSPWQHSICEALVQDIHTLKIFTGIAADLLQLCLNNSTSTSASEISQKFPSPAQDSLWPPVKDVYLTSLSVAFHARKHQHQRYLPSLLYERSLVYMTQLRFVCHLRGTSYSSLQDPVFMPRKGGGDFVIQNKSMNDEVFLKRMKFLYEAFRASLSERGATYLVQEMSVLWGCEHDAVKLIYLQALLDLSQSVEEKDVYSRIEELLPQVKQCCLTG